MPAFQLDRLPATDEELWWTVQALFGVRIPRRQVCPDHCTPFQAFADAWFRRDSRVDPPEPMSFAIWHASRGLAGKSKSLAALGLLKAALIGADVTVLGGSMAQSANVHEYVQKASEYQNMPADLVVDFTATRVVLANKGRLRPLPASQKTVRSPHPSVLLMDEVDEMELAVYDAALGQPMPQPNYLGQTVDTMTVVSSTWQNPAGCLDINTPVLTRRGEVKICRVTTADQVFTRHGWRQVLASIDTGQQECVTVELASGRRLTCTPWHPFWTDRHGWVAASALRPGTHVVALVGRVGCPEPSGAVPHALAAPPPPLAARPHRPGQGEVVPVVAGGLGLLVDQRPRVVDGRGDQLEVPQAHAVAMQAAAVPDVVHVHPGRDGAVHLDPHPAVGQPDPLPPRVEPAVGLDAVAVAHDPERPQDAVVGVQVDDVAFAEDEVVNVHHHGMILPTWDLTVQGTHEYVANGLLVHNTLSEVFKRADLKGIKPYRWCVASGSMIETDRGRVPIERVTEKDRVLTRQGFRKVLQVIDQGEKPTLKVVHEQGALVVTNDHEVLTCRGWVTAGSLRADAAHPMAPVGSDPGVLRGELVPAGAMAGAGSPGGLAGAVLRRGHNLQMLDVDAHWTPAQMVELQAGTNRAVDQLPDNSIDVGQLAVAAQYPVPGTGGIGPVDALVALVDEPGEVDTASSSGERRGALSAADASLASQRGPAIGAQFHLSTVREVAQGQVLQTWDLVVEDVHEFIADGVVVHNCYRESSNPVDGWLSEQTIQEKKDSVSDAMWSAEYELGEPAIGNRAFDTDKVLAAFGLPFTPIRQQVAKDYEEYTFAEPERDARYVIGADWARENDYTAVAVCRIRERGPRQLVYFLRCNRRPWPVIIGLFNKAMRAYGASARHDSTGIGNVINDYLDERAHGFTMTGDKRAVMLSEYVVSVEHGHWQFPKIPTMFTEHRWCRTGDLYSNAVGYHLPDTVAMAALCEWEAKRMGAIAAPIVVGSDGTMPRSEAMFANRRDLDETEWHTGLEVTRSVKPAVELVI